MSHVVNQTMKCKVCFDSGKTVKEYSNHWVKDKTGKVICPTLLSLKCRYCDKTGHTVKFCTMLKNREKNENKKEPKKEKKQESTQTETKRKVGSLFSVLDDDSSDEGEVEINPITKKVTVKDVDDPELSVNVTLRPHQKHFATSYASVVERSQVPESEPKIEVAVATKESSMKVLTTTVSSKKKSWADMMDEESDDEWEDWSSNQKTTFGIGF